MALDPTRFFKDAQQGSTLPSLEDLLRCLKDPDQYPETSEYLGRRPELKRSLESIVQTVLDDTHQRIALAAFLLFKAREQRGEQPVHGSDQQDWFQAEAALCLADRQKAEEPKKQEAKPVAAAALALPRLVLLA